MPKFILPKNLTDLINQPESVEVNAHQLDEAVNELIALYPALRSQILTPEGSLHPFIMVFIGKYPITQLRGFKSIVQEDDVITLLYNISGG